VLWFEYAPQSSCVGNLIPQEKEEEGKKRRRRRDSQAGMLLLVLALLPFCLPPWSDAHETLTDAPP
jgi:hypothetical protein